MKICFNPAPFDKEIRLLPLELVDVLIVNEIEGAALAGIDDRSFSEILANLRKKYPHNEIIMTVGAKGSYYQNENIRNSSKYNSM